MSHQGMLPATPTVLVADDQPDVIAARDFDAVLIDLNYARDTTSGAEGLALISDLHARLPHLPLIAMTGWANVETAVEAMRRGARSYIPKPWNNDALVQVLRSEIGQAHARQSLASQWREAQAIHRALLLSVLPEIPGLQLSWRWEPASGFGGDYYDAFPLGPDHVALCIADVCGKGLPAGRRSVAPRRWWRGRGRLRRGALRPRPHGHRHGRSAAALHRRSRRGLGCCWSASSGTRISWRRWSAIAPSPRPHSLTCEHEQGRPTNEQSDRPLSGHLRRTQRKHAVSPAVDVA